MKNWIKTVCFLLWTCVMCTACIDDDVEEGTVDLQTGESIPVFSVVMDDGQIITSETLKGEVSLIVFFHTGCPDCRKELPVLQKYIRITVEESGWFVLAGKRARQRLSVIGTKSFDLALFGPRKPHGILSVC